VTRPAVRDATTADAAACAGIYAPYVLGTDASFETGPPGTDEMARRIAAALSDHAWLVAERDAMLVGYAYATASKPRPAYRWTCEVSVYVDDRQHRPGVGRSLYGALLERLAARGFRTAVASMTLPNPTSAVCTRRSASAPSGALPGRVDEGPLVRRGAPPAEHRSAAGRPGTAS